MLNRFIAIICICVCIGSSDAYGQKNKFKPEWNVGVGFGPTLSSVDLRNFRGATVRSNSYMQYHGGFAIRYITEKNLGVIAELNYVQNGWDQEFKENPNNFAHHHKLNYLEVPFLAHIYWGNKFRYVVNFGPKISYLLSESEKMSDTLKDYLSSGEMPESFITHQYFRDAEKKFDYGLIFGTGVEFRSGIGNFMLEGRYYYGLGDIYKNKKTDYFQRSSNNIISVKLTYYIEMF